MPLTYSTDKTVEPAKKARMVQTTGINIRLPLEGAQTVSFYYASLEAAGGIVVPNVPVSVPLADLAAKYPTQFQTVHDILKAVAYQEAVDSGKFEAGTVS